MEYCYKTKGVCSREIYFTLEDGVIRNVRFIGGCNGNLKAISKLVEGQSAQKISDLLAGNTCASNVTSCADQFATALQMAQSGALKPLQPAQPV